MTAPIITPELLERYLRATGRSVSGSLVDALACWDENDLDLNLRRVVATILREDDVAPCVAALAASLGLCAAADEVFALGGQAVREIHEALLAIGGVDPERWADLAEPGRTAGQGANPVPTLPRAQSQTLGGSPRSEAPIGASGDRENPTHGEGETARGAPAWARDGIRVEGLNGSGRPMRGVLRAMKESWRVLMDAGCEPHNWWGIGGEISKIWQPEPAGRDVCVMCGASTRWCSRCPSCLAVQEQIVQGLASGGLGFDDVPRYLARRAFQDLIGDAMEPLALTPPVVPGPVRFGGAFVRAAVEDLRQRCAIGGTAGRLVLRRAC